MNRRVLRWMTLATLAFTSAHAQTFPKRKMESLVQQILEQRAGVRGASVECPVATPIGVGNRAVCTATSRAGETFSVDIIQTDETGGINFTVNDAAALEALEPAAQDFFERWKTDNVELIFDDGHESLHQSTRIENFAQLLRCTAADFGGLDAIGEATGAAIHRGDGSGQILASFRFGDGPGEVKLDYRLEGEQWQLSGISLPIPSIDHSTVASDALLRHAARMFERVDARDWGEVGDMLSYELRKEATDLEIREALDDPWQLGPVERVEMTAFGRNAGSLPILFARIVREGGEQRAWLVFRSCGDDWKVRVMQLLDPAAELPNVKISEVQMEIVQSLDQNGIDISLECPGSEIAQMPGIVYTCHAAHDSGIEAPLEIRVGEEGGVTWELLAGAEWDPLFE